MAKARVFRKGGFGVPWHIPRRPQPSTKQRPHPNRGWGLSPIVGASLFLQLPLQNLDFLRECHVVADQAFDLADRVQNRRVVTPAETPADFRQRT